MCFKRIEDRCTCGPSCGGGVRGEGINSRWVRNRAGVFDNKMSLKSVSLVLIP